MPHIRHQNAFLALFLVALSTLNSPLFADQPPPLMLAKTWESEMDPTGWWLSEKYDGIRGYWDGQAMRTRGGELIHLPSALHDSLPPFPVDGELWGGPGQFTQVARTVRDAEPGPGWRSIRYLIFDAPDHVGEFEARMETVRTWLGEHPSPQVALVDQIRCRERAHLLQFHAEVEAHGGEGVMLRAAGSPYEAGRSPHLRKFKSFDDAEATVIGYNPGRGKYQGLVGSLRVELPDGTRFSVGSGLSDAERRDPPPPGSQITFKHQGWTSGGKPRFPVFWRMRRQ